MLQGVLKCWQIIERQESILLIRITYQDASKRSKMLGDYRTTRVNFVMIYQDALGWSIMLADNKPTKVDFVDSDIVSECSERSKQLGDIKSTRVDCVDSDIVS